MRAPPGMALASARRCVLRAARPGSAVVRPAALRRGRASRAAPPRAAAATTHLKELRIKARAARRQCRSALLARAHALPPY